MYVLYWNIYRRVWPLGVINSMVEHHYHLSHDLTGVGGQPWHARRASCWVTISTTPFQEITSQKGFYNESWSVSIQNLVNHFLVKVRSFRKDMFDYQSLVPTWSKWCSAIPTPSLLWVTPSLLEGHANPIFSPLCTVDLCVCHCNRPPAPHVSSLTQSYIHTLGFPNVKATDLVTLRIPDNQTWQSIMHHWLRRRLPVDHSITSPVAGIGHRPRLGNRGEAEIPLAKNPCFCLWTVPPVGQHVKLPFGGQTHCFVHNPLAYMLL